MLREGSGEPLLLFHGILCTERVWRHVVPLLTDSFEVIVPNALGHRGGGTPSARPVSIDDVIDDAERQLDELGLDKAHLAGNSMGGWTSLELARRGRATSVCAISPAGFWEEGWAERDRAFDLLHTAIRDTRRGRRILPLLSRSARFRHWALADVAVHGERVTREEIVDASDDTIACEVGEEMIRPGYSVEPLDPAPCPVTLAWAGEDRLFPLDVYRERAQQLVPGASFVVLEDTGHVPMYDDPQLVADTIRAATKGAASSSQTG